MAHFCKLLPKIVNVLGCIEADFYNGILVFSLQHFSKSTIYTLLHRSNSEFSKQLVNRRFSKLFSFRLIETPCILASKKQILYVCFVFIIFVKSSSNRAKFCDIRKVHRNYAKLRKLKFLLHLEYSGRRLCML